MRLSLIVASLLLISNTGAFAADPSPTPAPSAFNRSIDIAHSRATFSVTHLYVDKVTGDVPILAGTVALRADSTMPVGASATLNPKRIDTHDPDRNDSLQGPDWFDVKLFPTWTFTSASITPKSNTAFTMNGFITIHGVTRPVTLDATITHGLPNPTYHAVGHLDRHAFGMRVTPIDGMIGGDLELTIDIALK